MSGHANVVGTASRWRGRRPSGPPTRGARRRTSLAAGPETRITATPARPGAEESAYTVSPGATSRAPEVEHVSEEELARRAAARRAASGGGEETEEQDARASRGGERTRPRRRRERAPPHVLTSRARAHGVPSARAMARQASSRGRLDAMRTTPRLHQATKHPRV